jgi:hypothetical protein
MLRLPAAILSDRRANFAPIGLVGRSSAGSRQLSQLAVERRVLGLLAKRCSFRAPEMLFVSNSGFDVRQMVPGRCDPFSNLPLAVSGISDNA